jgi:hypothetical protein
MSEAIQFRRYADEALRWAAKAATEREAVSHGACAHVDASGDRERASYVHGRQLHCDRTHYHPVGPMPPSRRAP